MKPSILKSERMGLTMVIASLVVIALIFGLLFNYHQKSNEAEIRSQGVSLVRLLSEMSLGQLVVPNGQGMLHIIHSYRKNPDLAYGVIVDAKGVFLSEIAVAGVIVPRVDIPAVPSSWLGERELKLQGSGQSILEFHAPLIIDGDLGGYIRLGYFKPGFGLSRRQIPFFAALSLPIFLLVPLFYYLLKREISPLMQINNEIQDRLDQRNLQSVEIQASGEFGEFMNHFNQFVSFARERIDGLENQHSQLQTSTKILSYKRARVESVLQSLPDAVIVIDESGIINFANSRLTTLLGIPYEEVIGKRPSDWCQSQEVLVFLSKYDGGGIKGYATDHVEFIPDSAAEKTIQVKTYPLFSPQETEHIYGTLVVFRDVTAESHAKRSRGEFVAHVAHELKSPLNVLSMYSEALQGEDGHSAEFRIEAVNVISDEVERLSMLINNMLSITKIEMGSMGLNRGRTKLRDLLQDSLESVSRNGREQGIQFHLDVPKEMSPVSVDKDMLRIAINNLLTNAIKYNIPGGHVTLFAEETQDRVCIGVRDTGIGIEVQEQQQIFEKFYRSEDKGVKTKTGHGLGLALAKEIVQLHHGQLTVNSIPGEGAEFIIEMDKETNLLQQAI
ncbi:MAG: PAS domain-containing protein [Gammaproteobacteria bacterium]|nr:PAS domain-containing protein [Gammaproteobacteria bacterium]